MKIVFIFSEGSHDVAFIKLVLELCCNISHEKHAKICEFPKPLNDIFLKSLSEKKFSKESNKNLTLDNVHKFLLPDYVFKNDACFIMLFNTTGMTNYTYAKELLSMIVQYVIKPDGQFDFNKDNIQYLFTYDADDCDPQNRIGDMKQNLFPITVNDSYPEDAKIHESSPSILLDCENKSIHFYIWPDNKKTGTLEDILLPIYRNKYNTLMENSQNFITTNFSNYSSINNNIAKKAKASKACMTIAGQGERPGKPLSAIVEDNVLADDDSFRSNEEVIKFSEFLKTIIDDK